ncbi:MAG: hypothetical protein ACTHMQ_09335 [Protaetiibacter sp.]
MTLARDLPGIRVIRPLGRDAHRETWLVRLEGEPPGPAVLVRPCDAAGRRMVRFEAAALHRGRGVGVVELVDVVGDPEGMALLREHCVGPRLAAVLAEREHWQAGEVVAALQPVVAALDRLHRSGVAHGVVNAGEIIVRSSGGVLVDLGRAELFESGSPEAVLARVDAISRDRDAARALASDLLRRVTGSRSHAAHALADTVEQAPAFRLLAELCDGLDELAAPLALGRNEPPASAASEAPAAQLAPRLMPVVRAVEEPTGTPLPAGRSRYDAMRSRIAGLRARLDALPAGRRRFVVGAGAAVTAAAMLLALPKAADAEPPSPPPSASTTAPGEQVAPVGRTAAADAAIEGDDPVAAAVALLERRQACFVELSLLCLEEVNQQGSAASTSDRAAMQALRGGEEAEVAAVDSVDARLTERWGDSALVEVGPETDPASLLLMRSEAGWRIRDWVAIGVD